MTLTNILAIGFWIVFLAIVLCPLENYLAHRRRLRAIRRRANRRGGYITDRRNDA